MIKKIYVNEKRVSVEYAYQMFKKGKLSFPETPLLTKKRMQERLSETVELILLGVAVPVIYVAELQDGSWLVLEATDRLRMLFRFLDGDGNLGYMDMYPEHTGMSLGQMEMEAPDITSMIYGYNLQFQIIDYMTPRYLQLQVGSYLERWNFSREQGARNALYRDYDAVLLLELLAKQLDKTTFFFSSSKLNRHYMILRIYMYRLVFQEISIPDKGSQAGIQLLLDSTMELLDFRIKERTEGFVAKEFKQVTEAVVKLEKNEGIVKKMMANRGKEPQVRRLAYLFNLTWLAMDGKISWLRYDELLSSENLWERIEKDDVNYDNIRQHYDMILKDRGSR